MTPEETLQRVLEKATTQNWKFGSNNFKVGAKDGEVGFWEGGYFYNLQHMITLNGFMNAIFGEKTIVLRNGESVLAKVYYRQMLLEEENPWEIIEKYITE